MGNMISNRYKSDGSPTLELNQLQLEMKHRIADKVTSGDYQFEEVNCAICDGNKFEQLSEKDRYGLYCSNVVCRNCGLVMINPRMIEASYHKFYNQEYRSLYTGLNSNAANFFKGQLLRGERLFDYFISHGLIPNNKDEKPFILEVGCGAGGILSYFRSKGFEVKGIDLGEEYLQYGRQQHGLDLEVGTIHDLDISGKPDLIIYSHVLEHVLDLNQELIRLGEIAGEHTLIYVEVPGIKNLATGYRNDPLRYFQNAHTYSFSLTSLMNLFSKHNFEMMNGNEFVKVLFKPGTLSNRPYVNDYENISRFLKKAEARRKFYFISFARMKVVLNAITESISKAINNIKQ